MGGSIPLFFEMFNENGKGKAGIGAILATIALSACAAPPPPPMGADPHEDMNRTVHSFNKELDRMLLSPASDAYGVIPTPVQRGVSNFASNLDLPGDVLNSTLQGNFDDAIHDFFRFAVNSTFGFAGLLDPATDMGIEHRKTDFGETLHDWGVAQGDYLELPALGPSTERDAIGTVVDFAINPVSGVLPVPESNYASAAKIFSKLGDRHRYSNTVESVLYDSVDSYAQLRLLYLQNRRFELGETGGAADEADFIDPYEDIYAE